MKKESKGKKRTFSHEKMKYFSFNLKIGINFYDFVSIHNSDRTNTHIPSCVYLKLAPTPTDGFSFIIFQFDQTFTY